MLERTSEHGAKPKREFANMKLDLVRPVMATKAEEDEINEGLKEKGAAYEVKADLTMEERFEAAKKWALEDEEDLMNEKDSK